MPKSVEQWSNDKCLFMRGSIADNLANVNNMKLNSIKKSLILTEEGRKYHFESSNPCQ